MRRNMQANEIRSNIQFEFAVVGETSVRTISRDVLELMSKYQEQGILVKLVGIALKKPTSNPIYLTKNTISLEIDNSQESEDTDSSDDEVVSSEDTEVEEEEDDSND